MAGKIRRDCKRSVPSRCFPGRDGGFSCSWFLTVLLFFVALLPLQPSGFAAEPDYRALFQPPLPADLHENTNSKGGDVVNLGRMLYFDTRLSLSGKISCNSCHMLDKFGVDGEPTSPGHDGHRGTRNSPSVYNAAAHIAQFWDGRAANVEEQAKGPVLNPGEMAMPTASEVEERLRTNKGYREAFAKAFPGDKEPVTFENMARAIGAFERGLTTPAPFDRYLAGDDTALTDKQKQGLKRFVETGCTACHLGTYVGGKMFQKAGLVEAWPKLDKKGGYDDLGRFEITKMEADKMVFKVPSLRNIAKTGPYFHDGSSSSLSEAVKIMARHQLGKQLNDDDIAEIVEFLNSLTGELPGSYIQPPTLP